MNFQQNGTKRLATVMVVIMVILGGIYLYLNHRLRVTAEKEINTLTRFATLFATIKHGAVSANVFNNSVTVRDITIEPYDNNANMQNIVIDRLNYHIAYDSNNKSLKELSIKINGLQTELVTEKMPPEVADIVQALHMDHLLMDLQFDYRYKVADKLLLIKVQQNFQGLCKIAFGFILGNFNPVDNPLQHFAVMIKNVRFQYTDESLVSQMLDIMAKKQNMTRDQFIAGTEMRTNDLQTKNPDPKFADLLSKLMQFIKNPHTLTIDADPQFPLTIGELKLLPPEQMADRLNIQVMVSK